MRLPRHPLLPGAAGEACGGRGALRWTWSVEVDAPTHALEAVLSPDPAQDDLFLYTSVTIFGLYSEF